MSEQDELIEVKAEFGGFQTTGYPGAFPPKVEKRIGQIIESPCLHLFSGRSSLGDVRVDKERPEATVNADVFEFIKTDNRDWKFVVLDPPYWIESHLLKLKGYADTTSISASVPKRRAIEKFVQAHAENVVWFDISSPRPMGFDRFKTWMYVQGGYHTVRALTWLKRKGERLA